MKNGEENGRLQLIFRLLRYTKPRKMDYISRTPDSHNPLICFNNVSCV